MRMKIVAALSIMAVALSIAALANGLPALREHLPPLVRLAGGVLFVLALLASVSYLIFVAVDGAPKEDQLDRRYWDKWALPLSVFCWVLAIFDGVSAAKTEGWWWPAFLIGCPVLGLAATISVRATQRLRRRGPLGHPAGRESHEA